MISIIIAAYNAEKTIERCLNSILENKYEDYEIKTLPSDFSNVTEALTSKGLSFLEAGIQMIPSTYVELDEASAEKMQRLIDNLEDLDDVLEVYHNWDE